MTHHIRRELKGEDLVHYARRSVIAERAAWMEHDDAGRALLNSSVASLCDLVEALCEEVEDLRQTDVRLP